MKSEKSETIVNTKKISYLECCSLIVGTIIGSGIFITVDNTFKVTYPSIGFVLVFWLIGGIITMTGALCYAELGTMIMKSGGERHYLAESFGQICGITYSYIYAFFVKPMTISFLGLTVGKYFSHAVFGHTKNQSLAILMSAFVQIFSFLINVCSSRLAQKIQIIFTFAKLIALVIIIITGFVHMGQTKGEVFKNFYVVTVFSPINIGLVFLSIMWSFEGYNNLAPVVGEIKNIKRTLPISLIFSVCVITVVYCLTVLSYTSVLGYDEVSKTKTVGVNFAVKMFKKASFVLPIFICFSAFGALHGNFYTISRLIAASSYQKDIPRMFSLVRKKHRTPTVSLLVMLLISLVGNFLPLDTILSMCSFVSWIIYFFVYVSLIILKLRKPKIEHSFVVPIVVPVFNLIVCLFIVIMILKDHYISCPIIFVISVVVLLLHLIPEKKRKPKPIKNFQRKIIRMADDYYDMVPCCESDIS